MPECQGGVEGDKEGGIESDESSLFDESVIGYVWDIIVIKKRTSKNVEVIYDLHGPSTMFVRIVKGRRSLDK